MKRENQLVSSGAFVFWFGVLAFVPSLAGQELMILSWLGSMQAPVGLSAMLVGGVLFGLGKLQQLRNATTIGGPGGSPDPGPTTPAGKAATVTASTVRPNVLSGQAKPNAGSRERS